MSTQLNGYNPYYGSILNGFPGANPIFPLNFCGMPGTTNTTNPSIFNSTIVPNSTSLTANNNTTANNDQSEQILMTIIPLLLEKLLDNKTSVSNDSDEDITVEDTEDTENTEDTGSIENTGNTEDTGDTESSSKAPSNKTDENGMDGAKAAKVIANRFDYLKTLDNRSDDATDLTALENACNSNDKELAAAAQWWLNHSEEYDIMENGNDKSITQDGAFYKSEVTDYANAKEAEKAAEGCEMNGILAAQIVKANIPVLDCGDGKVTSAELNAVMNSTSDETLKAALLWFAENPADFAEVDNTFGDGKKLASGESSYNDEVISIDNFNGYMINYASA